MQLYICALHALILRTSLYKFLDLPLLPSALVNHMDKKGVSVFTTIASVK